MREAVVHTLLRDVHRLWLGASFFSWMLRERLKDALLFEALFFNHVDAQVDRGPHALGCCDCE